MAIACPAGKFDFGDKGRRRLPRLACSANRPVASVKPSASATHSRASLACAKVTGAIVAATTRPDSTAKITSPAGTGD
jgi:hypothetical protein